MAKKPLPPEPAPGSTPLPPGTVTQLDPYLKDDPWERLRYEYPGGPMDRVEDNRLALGEGVRRWWDQWQYTVHGRR